MPLETPVKVEFGTQGMADLEKFVFDHLTKYKGDLKDLHENRIPKMRKNYRGIPKDENKSFPWPNCSNLVVQVIGQSVDTLRARILGNIFEISPIFVAQLTGSWEEAEKGEDQRATLEEFMNLMGLEPYELDLYRVYSSGFGEAIKFGTVCWKAPWETLTEQAVVSTDWKNSTELIIYDGPRPEKLRFETWGADPHSPTIDQAEFKWHKLELNKYQLLDRKQKLVYDVKAVEEILKKADRTGPSESKKEEDADKGIQSTSPSDIAQEWDIYECWLRYWHNGKKYNIIYTYHLSTRTLLRAIFNFYPKNIDCFETARLGYDGEDGLLGFGFCEMLEHYQEEVSTLHNQRTDNNTLANTSILRVAKGSKLDSIFSLFPNATFPADKDEIEVMQMGRAATESVQYENLTLSEANARAGVDSPVGGSGGGVQNAKKGIYSAMGTFSVMQEGNRRVNVNTSDMRYAHVKLGRKLAMMYSHFGVGDRIKYFGKDAELLKKALNNYKSGRMMFPIKAATASVNRELEKQNDMLLTNIMRQHHMGIGQILQSITGPQAAMMPPQLKEYLAGVIKSSDLLMKHILRNFGHDDTSRFLPSIEFLNNDKGASNGNNGNAQQKPTGDESRPAVSGAGENSNVQPANATAGVSDSMDGNNRGTVI